MHVTRRTFLRSSATGLTAVAVPGLSSPALAQNAPIRIGVLYDFSGPLAAAGSLASAFGVQIAIDLINEKGGVLGKHKIDPVVADSQSRVDIAIREAERLIEQENVEIILGIFSSSHAVPLAAKMDSRQKILWITSAIGTSVLKDRHLTHVFRGQIDSEQYGEASAKFLAANSKAKLRIDPKDLRIAVIHEDGAFGTDIAEASERYARDQDIWIVFKERYSASASDLSSLVANLRHANADIILHTGYIRDITLFLRQAKGARTSFQNADRPRGRLQRT